MPIRRRDVLKLGALAGAAGLAPALASAAAPAVNRAAKPLDILILGGTGFTGPHQVRYALARGHRLTLFNRGRRPQDWPAEVEELVGDRETGDLEALKGRRWDVCIDNPTSVPHWVRDVGQVLKGQVDHYVFISTLSVYSDSATPGQDEGAPRAVYTGADILAETRASLIANMALYGPMKAACEDEALKWFPDITTLIRPGLIVGPGDETDRFSYWPLRVRRGGDILAPGTGRDPVQFIDARDLAEWTVRMAEQRALGAFNAMGPAGRDVPLGARRVPRRARGQPVGRHAGVGAGRRRERRLRATSQRTCARRGPELPAARGHCCRHPGLVRCPARGAQGQPARWHQARARSRGSGGMAGSVRRAVSAAGECGGRGFWAALSARPANAPPPPR